MLKHGDRIRCSVVGTAGGLGTVNAPQPPNFGMDDRHRAVVGGAYHEGEGGRLWVCVLFDGGYGWCVPADTLTPA